MLFFGKL